MVVELDRDRWQRRGDMYSLRGKVGGWGAGQMSKAIQKQLVEVDRLQRGGEYTLRSGLGGWDRWAKLKLTDG